MKDSEHGKKCVLLFPYNGNSREALDCLKPDTFVIGFIDDDIELQQYRGAGYRIMGRDALDLFPQAKVLAVPGSSETYLQRGGIISDLNIGSERFITAIHPTASVSRHARIGIGVVIMAGVVIPANAVIGNHVCILPNTVIHHDVTVGDLTLIGSGVIVAGGVNIGRNCYMGSGTNIIHQVRIGDRALLGLGSNVIRNVPDGAIMAGNPARQIAKATKTQGLNNEN